MCRCRGVVLCVCVCVCVCDLLICVPLRMLHDEVVDTAGESALDELEIDALAELG